MGLFSKKPGGTFFGNLLRGVAKTATGGILGNGANRIEVGQTKTNAELYKESEQLSAQIAEQQKKLAESAGTALYNSATASANPQGIASASSVNWVYVVIGVFLAGLIAFKDKIFKKRGF